MASLLLKMQTVLNVPDSAVQEIIEQLCQISKLSQPLLQTKIKTILRNHNLDINEMFVKKVTSAVSKCNIMTFCAKDGPLGTTKRRAAYVRKKFPLVNPIVYVVEKGKKTYLHCVPVVPMFQKLLNKTDVLNKSYVRTCPRS